MVMVSPPPHRRVSLRQAPLLPYGPLRPLGVLQSKRSPIGPMRPLGNQSSSPRGLAEQPWGPKKGSQPALTSLRNANTNDERLV
jgi:hypothetical protein